MRALIYLEQFVIGGNLAVRDCLLSVGNSLGAPCGKDYAP